MFRKTAFLLALGTAGTLVLTATACSVHGEAKFGSDEKPPPPPPKPTEDPKPDPKPDPDPDPKPEPDEGAATLKGGKIEIPGEIAFDFGKATLKEGPENEKLLKAIIKFLDKNKEVSELRVEGHTDNVGKPAANEELSGQRALTIKKWLASNGVDEKRLMAVGCGETKPVAPNDSDEGRAKNRRTEFKLATVRGKKWSGLDPTGGCKVFE